MARKAKTSATYIIIVPLANDTLGKRYYVGETTTLDGWSRRDINWLLTQHMVDALEVVDEEEENDDG